MKERCQMKADIVILTAGKDNLIARCLESIDKHVDKSSLGSVIVCTTSPDAEEAMRPLLLKYVGGCRLDLKVTRMEYNYAKCNNAMLPLCTHERILFLNDDVELLEDAVTPCLKLLEDEEVGTAGIQLLYPNGKIQHGGIFAAWSESTGCFMGVGHIGIKTTNVLPDLLTFGSTGAFLMVRKSDFEKAGGFNELYEHCYEDVELNAQIAIDRQGYNVTLNTVKAIHRESSTRNQASSMGDFLALSDFMKENADKLSRIQLYTQYFTPEERKEREGIFNGR